MMDSVHRNLAPGGIFCFDFIDADKFIPEIWEGKTIEHEASFKGIDYRRASIWKPNVQHGWGFDWTSHFYKKDEGNWTKIGEDFSTIRTFTFQEIELFLKVHHFKIKERMERDSYAFPTGVVVAEK